MECPHLALVLKVDKENLLLRSERSCHVCRKKGKLWACLQENCQFNGCGESLHDHSLQHYKKNKHAVAVNLTSFRIWCFACQNEVHLPLAFTSGEMKSLKKVRKSNQRKDKDDNNVVEQPRQQYIPSQPHTYENMGIPPRGLTGLRNMGNTCYMNSALQAISNCPPLTQYFSHEDNLPEEKEAAMSKNYFQLIHDMWSSHPHPCIAPRGIHNTLRSINPSFRGYHQQDAQEFLRCFMDRLHEEMKYIVPKWTYANEPTSSLESTRNNDEEHMDTDNDDISDTSPMEGQEPVGAVLQSDEIMDQADSFTIVSEAQSPSQHSVPTISAATPHPIQPQMPESLSLHGSDPNLSSRSSANHDQSRTRKSKMKYPNQPPRPKKTSYRYRSIISEIFDGELRSSVQCLTCDQVSHTRETFQDLSLPIPGKDDLARLHGSVGMYTGSGSGPLAVLPGFKGPCSDNASALATWYNYAWDVWEWFKSWFQGPQVTLNDCLSAFFSADELKGDNMYSCNKCNKLRNGVKYCKLLQLPEVLCIHLKRFRHEYQMSYSSKISSPVSFPTTGLDLRQYLAQDSPSSCTNYDLCSIIVHHGNAGGGHYTAYAKNYIDHNWYEFDDQFITQVSESIVANAEAYVLFYKKSSVEASRARDRIIQINDATSDPSRSSTDLVNFFISMRWLQKFTTFAEPGPIDNSDFLCQHSGVLPSACDTKSVVVDSVSEATWRELHKRFGGGPAVTSLSRCKLCEDEFILLCERRDEERERFRELKLNADRVTPHVFISHEWFREWEDFVHGKLPEPPGKIDNWPICYTKDGKHILRKNSPHTPIPKDAWEYLVSVYGGGPEVSPIIRQTSSSPHRKVKKTTPRSPPASPTPMEQDTRETTPETQQPDSPKVETNTPNAEAECSPDTEPVET